MNSPSEQLAGLPLGDRLVYATDDLVAKWKSTDVGFEAVEPVLRFMEDHPGEDFGTPGSLTHFIERFYKSGYEQKLVESLARRPTSQTVQLLSRVIGGAKTIEEWKRYVELMKQARQHPHADSTTIEIIDFLLDPLVERMKRFNVV